MDAKKSGAATKAASKTKSAKDTQSSSRSGTDAATLLKADHRKVEDLFAKYEKTEDSDQKSELAKRICSELIIHTKLEEEIFYPACREKDVDDDMMDEAQVEHDGAKIMIAELMNGEPDDDYYDAKVKVLSEYIKHHVAEEEKMFGGIFAKAQSAGVDMKAVGAKIQQRKQQLMEDKDEITSEPPQAKSLDLSFFEEHDSDTGRYSDNRSREQGQYGGEYERGSSRGTRSNWDEDNGNGQRGNMGRNQSGQSRYGNEDESRSRSSSGWNRDQDYGSQSRGGYDRDREENRSLNQGGRSGRSGAGDTEQNYGAQGRGYGQRSEQSRYDENERGGRGSGGWTGDEGFGSQGRAGASRQRAEQGRQMSDNERGSRSGRSSSRNSDEDESSNNRSWRSRDW